MLFNSTTFAVFFVIVFSLYWLLRRSYSKQNLLLLIASYFFYGWWDIRFLFLIVVSTIVDYSSAISIDKGRMTAKERLLSAGTLISSALGFIIIKWDAVQLSMASGFPFLSIDWKNLLPDRIQGYWVLIAVVFGIALFNLLCRFLQTTNEGFRRKAFLFISVFINLCILGVFKYFNFFADSLVTLTETVFNVTPRFSTLNIVLPVGISFYTFQTMSHTIDVYRKKIPGTSSLTELAAYISFFPQLVAGPIERGAHLLPQFQRKRSVDAVNFREGLWLIAWGLYKKMVIADSLSKVVNSTFAPFDNLSSVLAIPEDGMRLLIAVYAFAVQIYCDFSGYSDIARGTAKLLGFDIMLNFNLPYFSKSPSEFWCRWHISLSTWLRDYLYIPLGGNRNGMASLYRNLMLTMILGGLWHGASWTFVIWGGFHGLILVLYRFFANDIDLHLSEPWWKSVCRAFVMFHLVCFGWLIFRAQNIQTIGIFIESIFTNPNWSPEAGECLGKLLFCSWFLILFQVIQRMSGSLNPMARWPWFVRLNVWLFIVMSLVSLSAKDVHEFIYFAF